MTTAASGSITIISIHAPRGGSDRGPGIARSAVAFQSTLPAGGATNHDGLVGQYGNISIHAPRGGSDPKALMGGYNSYVISIHAPRGGSDDGLFAVPCHFRISIHAPRGGSDYFSAISIVARVVFQSTLPAGGATGRFVLLHHPLTHFNPRSPRGERLSKTK